MGRRRLGWLLALPLVAGVLLAVPASPASASVASRSIVADSTVSDSNDKGKSVSCPAGTYVLGSGADVGGGSTEFVVIDEVIPTSTSVSAYAYEYGGAVAGNWTLRVWAVCGVVPGTLYYRSFETASNITTVKTAPVSCPAGTVLLGTGVQIDGARGLVGVESIIPSSTSVTVTGRLFALAPVFTSWSIKGYAICSTNPGGHSIAVTESTSNSDPKSSVSTCAAGKTTTGTGFIVDGPPAFLNPSYWIPTNPGALAYGRELLPTTNNWTVWSYAICVTI